MLQKGGGRSLLPRSLRGKLRPAEWPRRVEGESLPKLDDSMRAHRSAPSVIFFSGSDTMRQRMHLAALEDLMALSVTDLFVGTASSHYSAVAGSLRLLRAPPSAPPPIYADERGVARGDFSVGLLHVANLHRGALTAQRWSVASQRLEASARLTFMPVDPSAAPIMERENQRGACAVSRSHAIRWRHSPVPAPMISRPSFECVWNRMVAACPAWAAPV